MTAPEPQAPAWYALPHDEVAKLLDVDPAVGLSSAEAQRRLEQHGPNQLAGKPPEPGWRAFLRQYRDFMQIILVGAAVVNQLVTGQWGTTIVLLVLTLLNAVMGLNQEAKAEASLSALAKMIKNIARVRRDGQAVEVEADQLVPGDVVLIEAGNRVPADGRLFVAATLEIEEAALTGESVAAPKGTAAVGGDEVPLGDRRCMVYMNTAVTRGRGELMVTTTGMATEMGHIAEMLDETEVDKTPLQKQIDRLTLTIAGLAGGTFLIMLVLGLRNDQPFDELFLNGVALAIAAIPTGMPVVITTLYSLGTRVLADENAIVKRLPSVETLGSVSAICSDKTGTLTLNKMTAREFTVPGQNHYTVTGEGYGLEGQLLHGGGARIDLDAVMLPLALCADARLDGEELIGDPTEGALIVLAEKGGVDVDGARRRHPRIAEVPFDSDYKFMATFHEMVDEQDRAVVRCFVKGAPDVLIARGTSFYVPGSPVVPATGEYLEAALRENDRMAEAGERVMVVARRDLDPVTFDRDGDLIDLVTDLTLVAMIGIVDPPRPEARDAIAKCKSAGIEVRMITGDHAVTAGAIGRELGIHGRALTGTEFAALPDTELKDGLDDIGVVARVAPEDKIRLVSLLQEKGNIVAMTGDGVNDAPALKKADIGVAMGITGTEVSKEAAVMILTDDNFATIVKAVEYGRAIYDNLAKYVRFQITALLAFVISYLGAALFVIAGGAPFAPLVVLWVNVIQVPIAIALGIDSPQPGLMQHRPRPARQPILTRAQWLRMGVIGLLAAAGTLALEVLYEPAGAALAATMGFAAFCLFNVAIGVSSRSETGSLFARDSLGEKRQVLLYGIALLMTLLSTELRIMQRVLGLVPLTLNQWLLCIGLALGLILVFEAMKLVMRQRGAHAGSTGA